MGWTEDGTPRNKAARPEDSDGLTEMALEPHRHPLKTAARRGWYSHGGIADSEVQYFLWELLSCKSEADGLRNE